MKLKNKIEWNIRSYNKEMKFIPLSLFAQNPKVQHQIQKKNGFLLKLATHQPTNITNIKFLKKVEIELWIEAGERGRCSIRSYKLII